MERESVVCRCPRCKKRFQVLADEYMDHECPKCGYFQGNDEDENGEGE